MYNNRTIWEEIKWKYQTGGVLTQLIMINIAFFLVIKVVLVTFMLMAVDSTFSYDRIIKNIQIVSAPKLLIRQFWSVFTHMFAHEGLLHILFNMLWLYWFGTIFKQFIGESKLLPTYILGGLSGALAFIIAFNIFPAFNGITGYALGASAAVSAVIVATATMVPNYTMRLLFIGTVRLKWIAAVVVALDFISIPNGNAGGKIAHLGGALYGFIFIMQYKNGVDFTKPFYSVWDGVKNFFDFSSKPKKKKSKVKMAYKNEEKIRQRTSNSKSSQPKSNKEKQEKIDEILDKIGKSGYPSLSEEEKAFLFKYSKE